MNERRPLILLATGGMELSWRYAWATFLTTSILHHPFPFPEAIGAFVLAAALTALYHERGWRIIFIVCLHLLGFLPVAWRVVGVFNAWSGSFLTQAYKSYVTSFEQQGIPQEWMVVLLFLFWAFLFWGGGMGMAKRPRDYSTICSRFDRGLGALFLLLLIKFYLFLTGERKTTDFQSEYLILSYFIFGLLAIGLVRSGNREMKEFMPGFRGIGVILSFIVMVLLFGAGLALFALPSLSGAAKAGYAIVQGASTPLLVLLMMVIHFLFGGDYSVTKTERPAAKKIVQETAPNLDVWWLKLLAEVMTWIVCIILGLVLITILCATVYSLARWLFSKAPAGENRQPPWTFLPDWLSRLDLLLRSWWGVMRGQRRTYQGAVRLYVSLLVWGRRSGLPRLPCETPAEYGERLNDRFPALAGEVRSIVESFNREVYGDAALGEEELAEPRFGVRRLRSPSFWLQRLKNRIGCPH